MRPALLLRHRLGVKIHSGMEIGMAQQALHNFGIIAVRLEQRGIRMSTTPTPR
jgi:hypothetical protein